MKYDTHDVNGTPTNGARARHGLHDILPEYLKEAGDPETALVDLLADLMHMVDRYKSTFSHDSFQAYVERADWHFTAERDGNI